MEAFIKTGKDQVGELKLNGTGEEDLFAQHSRGAGVCREMSDKNAVFIFCSLGMYSFWFLLQN